MFDIESNLNDLMLILTEKYKKYTLNDHSSISVEKAQQFMNSILYCINGYLNSIDENKNSIITKDYKGASILYDKGLELEKENLAYANDLLDKIKNNALKIDNMSYQDTIFEGLDVFFKKYDILYAAHETPGDIDYQLCIDVEDISGVEFTIKYLEQLYTENIFCRKFDERDVKALLKGFSEDYRILLLNIFEIVLQNVLGLEILDADIFMLSISNEQKNKLQSIFDDLNMFELQEKLLLTLNSVLDKLQIRDSKQISYIRKSALKVSYNIKHCLNIKKLDNIFISSDYSEDKADNIYEDGVQMSSKALREFISEMQECRYTSDKISMIKESVHSLNDLIDVLDTCIWDDEYVEVFKLLSSVEIDILCEIVSSDMARGYKLSELKLWQKELLKYVSKNS